MKKLVLVVIVLTLGALSSAQNSGAPAIEAQVSLQQKAAAELSKKSALAAVTPLAPDACAFPFTSGADNTFLNYCVIANGNIVKIETPAGHSHIGFSLGEGYGICDLNTQTAYSDYAAFGDTGNWRPTTTLSHTGKSVKFARTTSDGLWTLIQTITQVPGLSPSIKIVMALRNNSSVTRHIFFLRYADIDADGSPLNNFDQTENSAFAWNSNITGVPFGLVMQNLGAASFHHTGLVSDTFIPPDACGAFNGFGSHLVGVDGSLRHVYETNIPPSGSLSVTLGYRGL